MYSGRLDIFIFQFNATGTVLQSKHIGSNATQIPRNIIPKEEGITIVGVYAGPWSIGGFSFDGNVQQNFSFLLELEKSLEFDRGYQLSSDRGNVFLEDATGMEGKKYILYGSFDNSLSIIGQELKSKGNFDLFIVQTLDNTTSIEESNEEYSLSIFPNPTSKEIILKNETQTIPQVMVFSSDGKQIGHYYRVKK